MTLTQILLIGLCILSVGFLVGMFGMLVLAWKIDKSFDELREFPLSPEGLYREKKIKVVKNEKRR